MIDTLSPESVATRLHGLIRPDEFVLWVGSGISRPVYEDWKGLILGLCEACAIEAPGTFDAESLMDKADECKREDPTAYHEYLRETFDEEPQVVRRAAQDLIRMRFKGYLTTNFDPLLQYAARAIRREDEPEVYYYPRPLPPARLGSNPRPIYHLHGHPLGCTGDFTNYVLSRSEYDDAYHSSGSSLAAFLKAVLTTEPVLFVGCELKEPEIQQMFREMRSMLDWSRDRLGTDERPNRYILLESRSQIFLRESGLELGSLSREQENVLAELRQEEKANEERLAFFDIEVIRYDPVDERLIGFDEICDKFCTLHEEGLRPSISGPVEKPE